MKLTKTVVEAATPRSKQYTLWCSELAGFGVYILPSGNRTYFVDYRTAAGIRRRMTIGRHGKITADTARKLAIIALGEAVRGGDPADERTSRRRSMTVKELCGLYLTAAEKGHIPGKGNKAKKLSTLYTDKGRIARHIVPLLGSKPVRDIEASDIARFVRDVAGGKTATEEKTEKLRGKAIVRGGLGTAARTAGLLGGILSFGVAEGVIPRNPAAGVKKPAGTNRVRRLTAAEYSRLGSALRTASGSGEKAQGVTAIKLLALTGCRLGEILNLRWQEVDDPGNALRLLDSKEGASVRPTGRPVFEVLKQVDREKGCPFVLPPIRSGERFGGLPGAWGRIMGQAQLAGITPHTMRHSFASVAGDLGFSDSTIAALLGHAAGTVTSRYVHHLDTVLVAAANRVAQEIEGMMEKESGG